MMRSLFFCLSVACLFEASFQDASRNCEVRYDICEATDPPVVCSPIGGSDSSKLKCVECDCRVPEECVATKGNGHRCECQDGWTGDDCSTSIDDCANNLCDEIATCIDEHMSYSCSCPAGYTLNNDGVTCDEDDECESDPCDSLATCTDGINSFTCTCPTPGYTLNNDGVTCDEDDECESDPCDSLATCTDGINSFTCTCPTPGYTLNNDGVTCDDVDECQMQEAMDACQAAGNLMCVENATPPGFCCN